MNAGIYAGAARLWPLWWQRFCVCPRPGVAASTRPHRVPRPTRPHRGLRPANRSPQSRRTETGRVRRYRAGRRGTHQRARDRVIPLLVMGSRAVSASHIRAMALLVIALPAIPAGRMQAGAMRPRAIILRGILATGSISIAIFRYRIRSGCCAAILDLTGFLPRNKSGC